MSKTDDNSNDSTITPITGVRDLRSALEWYRIGKGRGADGISIQIAGVWDVICGNTHRISDEENCKTLDDVQDRLLDNRSKFQETDNDLTTDDVDRVIALLEGLSDTEREHRLYGEDRERSGRFDMRARCWVGLYHVTDATTIMVYQHRSPGIGMTAYTNQGVEAPRMDIEEKLRNDVFYSKYNYTRLR